MKNMHFDPKVPAFSNNFTNEVLIVDNCECITISWQKCLKSELKVDEKNISDAFGRKQWMNLNEVVKHK